MGMEGHPFIPIIHALYLHVYTFFIQFIIQRIDVMRHLLRRMGLYLIALWAAVTFNFIIPRLMPGDPAEAYIVKLQTQQVTREQINAIRELFGVNPSIP